jgi:hypothetical protein
MWSHPRLFLVTTPTPFHTARARQLIIVSMKALIVLYAPVLGWIFIFIQLFDKLQEFVAILFHRDFGAKLLDTLAV